MSYSKYGAKRTLVDGISFASRAEARHYGHLKILERAGVIKDLQLQVRYPLVVNGVKVTVYVADFVYSEGGERIVVDVKGFKTPEYKLKRALMKAVHSVDIHEVS